MLGEDADEPLDGAEHHGMDHNGAMLFPIGAHIGDIEAFRHLEIQLDGAALPGTADGVLQVEVDLGAVEGAVSLVDGIGQAASL